MRKSFHSILGATRRQTRCHCEKPPPNAILPNMLIPGLSVVFCGTAPGRIFSAEPSLLHTCQNKFWRVLHEVGLTPRLFEPSDYARLLDGIAASPTSPSMCYGMDDRLPPQSLGREAAEALRARIENVAPRRLAFTKPYGRAARDGVGSRIRVAERKNRAAGSGLVPAPRRPRTGIGMPKPSHALAKRVQKPTA